MSVNSAVLLAKIGEVSSHAGRSDTYNIYLHSAVINIKKESKKKCLNFA